MKKIVVIVRNEDLDDVYGEITSNLDYDDINYSSYIVDLDKSEEKEV